MSRRSTHHIRTDLPQNLLITTPHRVLLSSFSHSRTTSSTTFLTSSSATQNSTDISSHSSVSSWARIPSAAVVRRPASPGEQRTTRRRSRLHEIVREVWFCCFSCVAPCCHIRHASCCCLKRYVHEASSEKGGGTRPNPSEFDRPVRVGSSGPEGEFDDLTTMIHEAGDDLGNLLNAFATVVGFYNRETMKRRVWRGSLLRRDPSRRRVGCSDCFDPRLVGIVFKVENKDLGSMEAEGGTKTGGGGDDEGLVLKGGSQGRGSVHQILS